MKAKIKEFLNSNILILLIALFMGFLCHYFVTNEIMASDNSITKPQDLYSRALSIHQERPLFHYRQMR